MVHIGPLAPITCPNGAACPHDLTQHRYDAAAAEWTCAATGCRCGTRDRLDVEHGS